MKVIIMAGGRGTRISELFPDIPKPLIPIDNIPVLEREIYSLRDQGFTDIILTVSYLHKKIQKHFGDGSEYGVHISYFVEDVPLGNAGALFKLRNQLGTEPFLLLNADAVFCKTFLEKNAELFGEFCISKLEKIAEVPVGHFLPTGYQCRHS